MSSLLIIDDDRTDRLLMRLALLKRDTELDIIELAGGIGAVELIKCCTPNATILDIRMPGMDGFDVLRRIRSEPGLSAHTVIMVSGSEEPRDKSLAQEAGADGFLTKPASLGQYGELADTICEQVFGDRECTQ